MLTFYYPSGTMPISVTGNRCSLNCRHCGGIYLRSMRDISHLPDKIPRGINSFLISGGCNREGKVEVLRHKEVLERLREKFSLNIHVGLLGEGEVEEVSRLAHVVSFDFLVDDKTIKEVYGLSKTGKDYIRTYLLLRKKVKVVPHITVGILGGKIRGEFEALKSLSLLGADRLVFLVFIPTKGTFYEKASPPSMEDLERVLSYAKKLFPNTPMGLGCMHPRGRYKRDLEMLCLEKGFNFFVNPSKYLLRRVEKNRIPFQIKKECCCFS